ncbi:MAG TPA: TraR/DksA family transcriptional regulator [Flavobacteriales bacterium]|nr:TraR/DksA family transcriptional regulator [Flavobacteriales bacterium]
MDPKHLEEIKQKFIEEINKTEASVAEYRELTKPIAPENAIGRISRMDAINNKSIIEAALRKAEEKLNMLREGLGRVDEKDFGLCSKCYKVIPAGRLLLMPHSRYCVNCA